MTQDDAEAHYDRGHRMAWTSILQQSLRELGYKENPDGAAVLHLEQARSQARILCEQMGLVDPGDLHLADIIEKRIGRAVLSWLEDQE